MAHIEFTDNYQDLSTDNGYQFKFFCQCCGNGYMSSWKANTLGVAGGLLRGAGQPLRRSAAAVPARAPTTVQHAIGGPAHDSASRRPWRRSSPSSSSASAAASGSARRSAGTRSGASARTARPSSSGSSPPSRPPSPWSRPSRSCAQQDLTEGIDLKAEAAVLCPHCGAEAQGGQVLPRVRREPHPQGRVREVRRPGQRRHQVLSRVREQDVRNREQARREKLSGSSRQ